MQRNPIQSATIASQSFQAITAELIKANPLLLQGTHEALIDLTFLRLPVYGYDRELEEFCPVDNPTAAHTKWWRDYLAGFYRNAFFQARLTETLLTPQFGLKQTDPHIRFAEAWFAYSFVRHENGDSGSVTNDAYHKLSYTCCAFLLAWSQVGYRLDWTAGVDRNQANSNSAPTGRWTIEWTKLKTHV